MNDGSIAEMKTGEGKTLVSTLAVYLNALSGKGVHVVTVNDYLANRDSQWMGKIYEFLGLKVGCVTHKLFQKDTHYIVRGGKVVIIDEFTGRAMEGRRFSDGLHQAIEARENVDVLPENQTLASVTFQNYFRQYPKLAGMTGTAITEAGEFEEIYCLQVI